MADFGARILVVAPLGCERMESLAGQGRLRWERRCFMPEDLEDRDLIIAATDDARLNGQIVRDCRNRQILVNHAGDKSQCDFFFPGIAREGNVVVGVTASGRDHRLASEITGSLQSWLKQFFRGR